jgi:hypothetical protein
VNISKQQHTQVDHLDKQRLERAFPGQQRIHTHAQQLNAGHWKHPVDIPYTKKAITVDAPKTFALNDRDPIRDSAAFKAANPLSYEDCFDIQNRFPLMIRIVFRPVLE